MDRRSESSAIREILGLLERESISIRKIFWSLEREPISTRNFFCAQFLRSFLCHDWLQYRSQTFFARVSFLLNRILFDCRREIFDFLELESASSQEIRYLLELESISIRKILVLLELESISIRKILGLLERESISIRKIASDFEPCL